MTINFDMDGTIADLYSVENWLPMLRAYDPTPYASAKPLLPMTLLLALLLKVKEKGYEVNILSWSSKESNAAYDREVETAKRKWLADNLPQFPFDNIKVVPYGTPKSSLASGILFDDEEKNRTEWEAVAGNRAYEPSDIFKILEKIA